MSTVRRPSAHRAYLREVSKQTTVLHLQGFLFFGTIMRVEETIRALVTEPAWVRAPIRFLVPDFALVLGVDLSAAEAFRSDAAPSFWSECCACDLRCR
jgi:SulP family sulfate permease